MSSNPVVWLAGIVTLVSLSYLWGESKVYRLVQSAFVGVAAGYSVVMGVDNVLKTGVDPLVKGNLSALVALILGAMLFLRFSKPLRWIGTYPISLLIGMGTGITMRSIVDSEIIQQIRGSMLPLTSIDNTYLLVGTLAGVMFFVFTYWVSDDAPGGSAVRTIRSIGLWTLMIMFGASFGNAVQGRMSLLIGRFQFLFFELLGL